MNSIASVDTYFYELPRVYFQTVIEAVTMCVIGMMEYASDG